MDERRTVKVSKYVSKHLRHQPERIGLVLDPHGWVEIDDLLHAAASHGFPISRAELDHVVAANDKQRFAVDGTRIRPARATPSPSTWTCRRPNRPRTSTTARWRPPGPIRAEGLRPMARHHVHLSPDRETATRVGARRGRPVVLSVDAGAMRAAGHVFRISANGVWLVEAVPPAFLRFP